MERLTAERERDKLDFGRVKREDFAKAQALHDKVRARTRVCRAVQPHARAAGEIIRRCAVADVEPRQALAQVGGGRETGHAALTIGRKARWMTVTANCA